MNSPAVVHLDILSDEYSDSTWLRGDLAETEAEARAYIAKELRINAEPGDYDELGDLVGDGPSAVVHGTLEKCVCGEGCADNTCEVYYPLGAQPADWPAEPHVRYWRFQP